MRGSPEEARLVEEALPIVAMAARQMKRSLGGSHTVDDLASFGHEGLLLAARSFDATRGIPFRRWANIRINGAILDGVRASGVLPRRVYQRLRALEAAALVTEVRADDRVARPGNSTAKEADQQVGQSLTELATAMALGLLAAESTGLELARDGGEDPEAAAIRASSREQVRRAIDGLPADQRSLLRAHYFEEKTLEEAGRGLGLSKSWASRLHARAVEALAKKLDETA